MNRSHTHAIRLRAHRLARHRRLLLESLELRACPATFFVNSTADSVDEIPGDGLARDALGRTTLRAAVMEANVWAGNDTIELPAGTYPLTLANSPPSSGEDGAKTGDLDIILAHITIQGAGRDTTIIDASALGDRVFQTHGPFGIGLFNLTIRGGTAVVPGTLSGGALLNTGRSTITNVAIVNNSSVQIGGAIHNDSIGHLTISNSLLTGNSAGQGGGAITNFGGTVAVFGSTFENNSSLLDGGAIITQSGGFSIQGSTFRGNFVTGAANSSGGAISSRTFGLTIDASTFEANRAEHAGAILANEPMILTDSTFVGNEVNIDGGAIYLPNNPINSNHQIVNNTFSANRAGRLGGALFMPGRTTLLNNTVTRNDASGVGGIYVGPFGDNDTRIQNNIIAQNTGFSFNADFEGDYISGGGNLIGNGGGIVGLLASDQFGTGGAPLDPLLGPLADNGGPTRTHLPLPGSPAIDRGVNAGAPGFDQRGRTRPFNGIVDVGSVEVQGNTPPVAANQNLTTGEDTPLGGTVTATDADANLLSFAVVANPTHGTVTVNPTTGAFTYTPDANYNGPDSFTFKASDGLADSNVATISIDVLPDAQLTVQINPASVAENAGAAAATVTITRSNANLASALVVSLVSSDTTEATVPASATIAANQASVTVPLAAVNDNLLDGTQPVTITATASGFDSGAAALNVTDHETLTVVLSRVFIFENAGAAAATGTVTRSNTADMSQPLVVILASSDTTEGTVPAMVVIPANEASATFAVDAVDDTLLDFTQNVIVTASAPGYLSVVDNVFVLDFETLSLSIDAASVTEGGASATATVTRNNSNIGSPLTVNLLKQDNSLDLTVPATVVIPAGQASATFTFSAFDDVLFEATESASIIASHNDYAGAIAFVNVIDNDAAPFPPGQLLVSTRLGNDPSGLSRYTPAGQKVQEFIVPEFNGEWVRDVIVDRFGEAQLYNGTFLPRLTTLDPATGGIDHHVGPAGWSTVNNVTYGGVAVYGERVFATDMGTAGAAERGIIVFDQTAGYAASRILSATEFTDITLGLDGYLYALSSVASVTVINPVTLGIERQFSLVGFPDIRGIMGNTAGDVFAAGWDGKLYHFDRTGALVKSLTIGGSLTDIDLRSDGQIVAGSRDADVILSDQNLNAFTSFSANPLNQVALTFFVAFTDPFVPNNHAPAIANQSFQIAENSANGATVGTPAATDADAGDTLSYAITAGNAAGAFAIHSATGQITVANGSLLNFEANQQYVLTVAVTDNGLPSLSASATITIDVTNVNEPPVASDNSYSLNEDTPLGVAAPGVLVGDSDVDGNPLTAVLVSGPSHGTLTLNADGSFDYLPAANYHGPDSFTYKARDAALDSDVATVSLTVSPVNDAPMATSDSLTTNEDTPRSGQLVAADADGEALTYTLVTAPASGTLALNTATGAFVYTPAANFHGADSFQFQTSDGQAQSNVATISLTVGSVNDAPVATDATFSLPENSPAGGFVGQVQATDVDAGQSHAFAIVAGNTLGAFAIDSSGRITVANSAALDFEARSQFVLSVRVTDSGSPALLDTAEVIVHLVDAPDSPPSSPIDILPGKNVNTINMNSGGKVPVAIISGANFNAPAAVDIASLRFGHSGTEAAPVRSPGPKADDVNGDGRADLIVYFEIGATGFVPGDTWGVLRGRTRAGASFEGRDSVDLKFPGQKSGGSPSPAGVDALMRGEGESAPQPASWLAPYPARDTTAPNTKKKDSAAPPPRPKSVAPALQRYLRLAAARRRK